MPLIYQRTTKDGNINYEAEYPFVLNVIRKDKNLSMIFKSNEGSDINLEPGDQVQCTDESGEDFLLTFHFDYHDTQSYRIVGEDKARAMLMALIEVDNGTSGLDLEQARLRNSIIEAFPELAKELHMEKRPHLQW